MATSLNARLSAVSVMMMVLMLSACTTSTYGRGLKAIPDTNNEYLLKIYIGGFSGGGTADEAAETEIREFMAENHFDSYEIIDRYHSFIPSYFEYQIRFQEEPIEGANQ